MCSPCFMKLTAIDGKPVWINMNQVWRVREAREGGSMLYIACGDVRHVVKEEPHEIFEEIDEREELE